jgi:hypothetical protein
MHRTSLKALFTILPRRALLGLCVGLCGGAAGSLAGAEATREWQVSGETRVRYETLDGQFRSNRNGGDQGLFFRALYHARIESERWTAGFELQDSRSYLTDSGSPVSTSYINPLDFLQLYAAFPVASVFGSDFEGELILGRQTLGIGSQRQIERISFANVIKNYTGVYLRLKNQAANEWHAFVVSPVEQRPTDRDSILNNELELDGEQFNRVIWGLHFRKADAFPGLAEKIWGEVFVYGLYEWDAFGNESPNRRYVTPGFRLFRARTPGEWDFDLEGALRLGFRRASSSPTDTEDLDVMATMLIVRVGYTFDLPWRPNLAAQYYWASGDSNPDDGKFDQYERLFGSRRTDLNNTSLHGPLTPANLSAVGIRLEMKPTAPSTLRLTYSAAYLASATDSFVVGRQRDPSGRSGSFIGHVIDSRFTYTFGNKRWEFECGASLFLHGGFTRDNPQAPSADRTSFLYAQLGYRF